MFQVAIVKRKASSARECSLQIRLLASLARPLADYAQSEPLKRLGGFQRRRTKQRFGWRMFPVVFARFFDADCAGFPISTVIFFITKISLPSHCRHNFD